MARVFTAAGFTLLFLAAFFPSANAQGGTMREPHFGHTKTGHAVHQHTSDHLPSRTAVARFNSRLGVAITTAVGSMWAAYVFGLLALTSLPAILTQAFHLHIFPSWLINASLIALVAWISSYFLQLVLLPIIIVGQNVQSQAADARASKTFEDVEALRADLTVALDRLDEKTEGGLKAILDALKVTPPAQLQSAITLNGPQIKQLVAAIQANTLAAQGANPAPKRLMTPAERKGKTT